jgi:hypothetical protein
MGFFFTRIFPLIFIVVGASLVIFGIRDIFRAKASDSWPATTGTVIKSSVESYQSSSGSKRNAGGSTMYHADISYEFTVEGRTFNGKRVSYGDYNSSNQSHAQGIVDHYPKGKAVSVHYMSGNPDECLLQPGLEAMSWLKPVIGLVFLAAGILMAIFLPKAVPITGSH